MVEFCKSCGALLIPKQEKKKKGAEKKLVLHCPRCGTKTTTGNLSSYQVKDRIVHTEKDESIVVDETVGTAFPTTRIMCPNCKWQEAVPFESVDRRYEGETTLYYRCTRCNHTWTES